MLVYNIIYFSPIVETRRGRHIVCRDGIGEVHSHNIIIIYALYGHKRLYNATRSHALAAVAVSIKNVLAPHKTPAHGFRVAR